MVDAIPKTFKYKSMSKNRYMKSESFSPVGHNAYMSSLQEIKDL